VTQLIELAKGLGAPTLVTVFVLGLLTGWIVPRWTYNQIKEIASKWERLAMMLAEQNTKLLIGVEVSTKVAKAVHEVVTGDDS
jgi:hypothetical protein